jgi:hypothetical protein
LREKGVYFQVQLQLFQLLELLELFWG